MLDSIVCNYRVTDTELQGIDRPFDLALAPPYHSHVDDPRARSCSQ